MRRHIHFFSTVAAIFSMVGLKLEAGKLEKLGYDNPVQKHGITGLYLTSIADIEAYKEKGLEQFDASLKAFLETPVKKRTVENTLHSFDRMINELVERSQLLHTFALVDPSDDLREAYLKASIDIQNALIEKISEQTELFPIMNSFQKSMEKKSGFSKKYGYLLSKIINDMKSEGMHLSLDRREKIKKISKELVELQQSFEKNIREDESSVAFAKESLTGLPEHFLDGLQKNEEGEFLLTCDYPTYNMVMQSCENQEVRKELFRAFNNRAYPQNIDVLHQIINKRDHLAKELEYKSFAHMQLSNEMVKSPEKVQDFLKNLISHSQNKEKEETEALKKILGYPEDTKLLNWDGAYARQKYKSTKYSYDDNLLSEYFPLESTIAGLISIYESFFDLEIKEEPVSGLWSQDVKLLKITQKGNKKESGYILLDLFPRKNKYSHACSSTLSRGLLFEDGSARPTVNLLIMNFTKPGKDRPALMTMQEVNTFFHEFGHGIHDVLGRTEFLRTSGYLVEIDFVELPSQMLEEWLKDPSILKKISKHYQTNQPLSDDLIEKIVESRKMDSGNFVLRQGLLSRFSLECFLEGDDKDTISLYKGLYDQMVHSWSFDPKSHHQASFGHLDEYGARYYGYLWSRVFALDVFSEIKKEGLLNPKAGKRYIKEILSKGGSEDPEVMLRNYLKREPSLDAFLDAYGLN